MERFDILILKNLSMIEKFLKGVGENIKKRELDKNNREVDQMWKNIRRSYKKLRRKQSRNKME